MTVKEIFQFAYQGISAKIESLEKEIKQGYFYINQINDGKKIPTKLTKYEILDIIHEKEAEMKRLENEKFTIKWQIEVEMKDQN